MAERPRGAMPRILTVPSADRAFRAQVERLRHVAPSGGPAEFEARLRRFFPRAIVRFREISGEPATWYVYRDGSWRPDLIGPWWTEPNLPRVVVSSDGWLTEASPTALDLLGLGAGDLGSRHFTDFVAPGTLEDSLAMFAIVAEGNELTATVHLRPTSGEVLAIDIHARREGDGIEGVFRLAEGVDVAAVGSASRPTDVVTVPSADLAFRGYVDAALARMPEPTVDGLTLRLRRLYPHAHVTDEDGRWTANRDRVVEPAAASPTPDSASDRGDGAPWWADPGLARVRYDTLAMIVEANPAAEALLGRALVGHHWQEFVTPGSTDEVAAMLEILAATGGAESRFRMPRADGTLVEFDSYTSVEHDGFTTVMRPLV